MVGQFHAIMLASGARASCWALPNWIVPLAIALSAACDGPLPLSIESTAVERAGSVSHAVVTISTAPNTDIATSAPGLGSRSDADGKSTLRVPLDDFTQPIQLCVGSGGRRRCTTLARNEVVPELTIHEVTSGRSMVSCSAGLCEGSMSWEQGALSIEAAAGTLVELGAARATIASPEHSYQTPSVRVRLRLDFIPAMADVPLADALTGTGGPAFQVPLRLTFPNGKVASTILTGPRAGPLALAAALANADLSPVAFSGERGRIAARSLLIAGDLPAELLGTATTLRDVDLIALVDVETSTTHCGAYRSDDQRASLDVETTTWIVTVVQRRTGKKVASRTFAPGDVCPSTMRAAADDAPYRSLEASVPAPDRAALTAWLTSRLR